jgi:class 3 adenylate cyclase/tetratricopeptide (TPR) repeat protein
MECPKCKFENREGARFCKECGAKLEDACLQCGTVYQVGSKFCDECGYKLEAEEKNDNVEPAAEGERKHVTVLFSDLSGYTAMSEKLDPEEVKAITSRIFGEISKIVGKYDGFIEKYAGDAVMALFGVPKAHEDDSIRAVKVACEIHDCVEVISPEIETRIGQPLSMHSGINSGLVVTGEVDMERGTHGVAGDTINLASRLSGLANTGEILVDTDTYRQAEGHFTFESLEPTVVKGKAEPIQVHKVLSQKDKPITIRRLSGVRADLVGRKVELAELAEAIENLREGKGRIFSICGDAGTGKSRLVEEFKALVDLEEIQWLEGHAYAYAQNIPYYPMIDLLNRVFHIEEGDPAKNVREKLESGIEQLVGNKEEVVPYIGGLYSLSYPEVEEVSPEFWKSRLQEAIQEILTALAGRSPTVFFLEDLHWADPSFVELLRRACLEFRQPAIVLCVYRPTFSLFTSYQISGIGKLYHEMRLQDLSRSESQEMVQSLLNTDKVPSDLQQFIHEKMEGNPFYLEEAINSLIESNTLVRDNGQWQVTKQISEADISSTIHGVISARVDRLEQESKRILQEASVIGRSFYYQILKKVTELNEGIDRHLSGLERLDLIKTKSIQPELEYFFKHALTQDVVYNGLLKKERRIIHERIGLVIEQLFHDRLPEFYEALAYHFKMGQSTYRAIDYLMKSGAKSLARYALDESQQYYTEAYQLIVEIPDKSESDNELLIDLLMKWALVFYYQGEFGRLTDLFEEHLDIAKTLDDKSKYGMFRAWLGFAFVCRNRIKDSYEYLKDALEIGEQLNDQKLIGYTCTWLTWTCAYFGLLDEAIEFGKRAQEIAKVYPSDHYMYFKNLGGMALAYNLRGDKQKVFEIGNKLVDFGINQSNIRSHYMGHGFIGAAYALEGNLPAAIENNEKAINTAADPFYAEMGRSFLGRFYLLNNQIDEAEKAFQQTLKYSETLGIETIEAVSQVFLGVIQIATGRMSKGLKLLKKGQRACLEGQMISEYCLSEYLLGNVYLQMFQKAEPISFAKVAKNIGFILKNVPVAAQKAEAHLNKAAETAKKIGAKSISGPSHLDLGYLHKTKKRTDKAKECFSEAKQIFEECEMDGFLKQANDALESL